MPLYLARLTCSRSSRTSRQCRPHEFFINNFLLDKFITNPVYYDCRELCLASREAFLFVAQALLLELFSSDPKIQLLGDIHVLDSPAGPRVLVYLHLRRRPTLPHSPFQQSSAPLLRPRPQGSPGPRSDPPRADLSFFFTGESVSARDLSALLADLLPAVAHGQCQPKTASTLAGLSRTMVRTIQLSQHEFISTHADERLPRPPRRPKAPSK